MIEQYLNEFYISPNEISNEKITIIKKFFYAEINQFKNIKRENFQVGINKNKNILFFRDKTNKHEEIILHLITNKKFNNFRKNISFTTYNNNSFCGYNNNLFEIVYDNDNNDNNDNNNNYNNNNNSKDPLITYSDSKKCNNKCINKCINECNCTIS